MKTVKKSTLINILLVALLAVILFVPDAKAGLMKGLISIGLFDPSVPADAGKTAQPAANPASEVAFTDSTGNLFRVSEHKGKVLFINFWATWCPPCRAEMPSIAELQRQFAGRDDVLFLLVDADGDYKKAKKFLERKKYNLPVYTPSGPLPAELFAGRLPTTVVIDKQGKAVYKHEGLANYADPAFTDYLQKLTR